MLVASNAGDDSCVVEMVGVVVTVEMMAIGCGGCDSGS